MGEREKDNGAQRKSEMKRNEREKRERERGRQGGKRGCKIDKTK